MTTLMAALLLAWVSGNGGAQAQPGKALVAEQAGPIRLYVFTVVPPKNKELTEVEKLELEERIAATTDIKTWLRDKKKKTISLVEQKDLADAVMEVVAVQVAPGMTLAERTSGYLHGPRYDAWTIRARVTAGAFSNEVSHQGQFPAFAAEGLAGDVERWTGENRSQLLANRTRGKS